MCVNKVTPTIFCDEEGFDIIPIQMIIVSLEIIKNEENKDHEEVSKTKDEQEDR